MIERYGIGLMSGTSLDGLDICYAKFWKDTKWNFEIIKAETITYSIKWREKLSNAIHCSSEELLLLDIEFGEFLGIQTQHFIKKNRITQLDFIASHGQTIFHQPKKRITLQIGYGGAIKYHTHVVPIICNFRKQDVFLGGQGAPLVPVGDEFLFSEYDACLNLGGFSNLSFKKNNKRIAYDICPVNIVLNSIAFLFGKEYDSEGNLAKKGNFSQKLFEELNELHFYEKEPPKALGFEWVERYVNPILIRYKKEEIIHTFSKHIVYQLAENCNQHQLKNVLITGGGTFNTFLIQELKEKTKTKIIIPEKRIIEFKEALIFAFLGLLRLENEPNILSSVTGVSENHCSGEIF